MLILTAALFVTAHALFLVVIPRIAESHGVRTRHFERNINYRTFVDGPIEARRAAATTPPVSLREFAQLRPDLAAKYVVPVLFPLDVVMMAALAGFLALGSVTFGARVPLLTGWMTALIVLPAIYFVADLSEDVMLAWLLTSPAAVSALRVAVLKGLTLAKLGSLCLAYVQFVAIAIAVATVWWRET